jgi:hypothetical protein
MELMTVQLQLTITKSSIHETNVSTTPNAINS